MIENTHNEAEHTEIQPIVLDIGSYFIKAGFAGDDAPKEVFPNMIGTPSHESTILDTGKEFYIGNEAQNRRGILSLSYPIQNGVVKNFDHFEQILQHTLYTEMRTFVDQTPVLMTDPPLNPKSNREKLTQLMFESFNVPALYFSFPSVLAHYASGRCTGVTIEIGEGGVHVVPIYEGYTFYDAINRTNLGGGVVTDYLSRILKERGYNFTTSTERDIVREIKEKLGYVALDFDDEIQRSRESTALERDYTLPDGTVITIGDERFRCAEQLFKPTYYSMCVPVLHVNMLVDKEAKGIHEIVFDTISKCDIDTRKDFYGNIIISGGSSMFDGLSDRMCKEIANLAPSSMKIKIVASLERKYAAWIGGSILASLSTFQSMWISKVSNAKNLL
jgi:actin